MKTAIKKKALVTGSSGYVGAKLVKHLNLKGWEVHEVLRDKMHVPQSSQNHASSIKRHLTDCSLPSLETIIQSVNPDCVFHLASHFVVNHDCKDIESLINSNIRFGVNLLEAIKRVGKCILVNAGTHWQYGDVNRSGPINLYAATKSALQIIIDYYSKYSGIKAISLIFYEIYGEDDLRGKIYNLMADAIESSSPLNLSLGYQKTFFVHIDDVCNAIARSFEICNALENGHATYSVRGPTAVSLRELSAALEKRYGFPLNANWGAVPYRNAEIMNPSTEIPVLPGWVPLIELG